MRQYEFEFMKDLLTPMEKIEALMDEESRREFDLLFLEEVSKLYL